MIRHNKTQDLLLYWTRLKADRTVPARADIKPRDVKVLLPNMFILHRIDHDHFIFRLTGTSLCHHFGREFRDHNFLSLWDQADRNHMRQILEHVLETAQPAVIHCRAHTIDNQAIEAELLLLPVANDAGTTDRVLGSAFALSNTKALAGRKLVRQKILHAETMSANDNSLEGAEFTRQAGRNVLRLVASNPDRTEPDRGTITQFRD